jgi:hypothetical protein
MALSPINPTQLTPPRVEFIDPRTGAISREWYRFFLSLLTATQANQEEVALGPDTASLLATYDAMLASATQASEVASDGMVASLESSLNSLQNAFGVTPPDLGGTVTSVAASGGTTGLTFTGSPITTSGTLTLGGTLAVANGGTGQTSYTNGQLLIGNTTGNTLAAATLTAGTNISITNGAGSITINASDAFVGTVTSVSVVSANGFAGTVATATTTPAITLSTSVTGLIKGNGTALSAAVAATDYVAPSAYASANGLTMATSRLLGRTTASTGAAEEISVAGGLTLSAGVLTGTSGTVTSVTGTSPVVSSGGATPVISMPAATTSVNGYLTSTDWTTFNNKGSGSVTSVSGTGTVNGITLTGTVTTSGSLTLGGTLSGVSLTTQVSGTLPVANGGTGATTLTSGYLVKGNGTSAVTASVVYDTGTNVGIGTTSPQTILHISTSDQSTNRLRIQNTGASGGNFDIVGGNPGASNIGLAFYDVTNAATRMYVNSSGNVGIGTVSPASKLDVAGTITVSAAAGNYTIDTSGAAVSVANGGTVNFSNASGMLLVNNHSNGFASIYLMGGGNVSTPGTQTYAGGAVGAVTYNAGINGYTWTNNTGSTATVGFMFFRTRTAA